MKVGTRCVVNGIQTDRLLSWSFHFGKLRDDVLMSSVGFLKMSESLEFKRKPNFQNIGP